MDLSQTPLEKPTQITKEVSTTTTVPSIHVNMKFSIIFLCVLIATANCFGQGQGQKTPAANNSNNIGSLNGNTGSFNTNSGNRNGSIIFEATNGAKASFTAGNIYNGPVYEENSQNYQLLYKQIRASSVKLNNVNKLIQSISDELNKPGDNASQSSTSQNKFALKSAVHKINSTLDSSKAPNLQELISYYDQFIENAKALLSQTKGGPKQSGIAREIGDLESYILNIKSLQKASILVRDENGIYINADSLQDMHLIIFPEKEGLRRVIYNKQFGFVDGKIDTLVVIKPTYDFASDFSEGYACVQRNGKLFYIDRFNHELIDEDSLAWVKEIHPFREGHAAMKAKASIDMMFYLTINKTNCIVGKFFSYCSNFLHGVALARDTTRKFRNDKKFYFIDTCGNKLSFGDFEDATVFDDIDVAFVCKDWVRTGYYAMTRSGRRLGTMSFEKFGYFNQGLAPVIPFRATDTTSLDGIIRITARETEKFAWELTREYDNGNDTTNYVCLIDTLGKARITPKLSFRDFTVLNNGKLVLFKYSNGKFGLYDRDGMQILNPEYDELKPILDDEHFEARRGLDKLYFKLDTNGFAHQVN